MRSNY